MNINSEQAKNIIRSLNDLIYDDIFIFDAKGALVGSNKTEADLAILNYGVQVASSKSTLVVGTHAPDKKAIFLPVLLNRSLVAIVGLVGDYSAISQYGDLVVKIVEILLSESKYYTRKIQKSENNRRFVSMLLKDHPDMETLDRLSQTVNRNMGDLSYLALIDTQQLSEKFYTNDLIISSIEKKLTLLNLVTEYGGHTIILFFSKDHTRIIEELNAVQSYVVAKYDAALTIAISDVIEARESVRKVYIQTLEALKMAVLSGDQTVCTFSDLVMDLIHKDIRTDLADGFLAELFSDCSEVEIDEMDRLIRLYVKCDTSLKETSERLFIHKNTLQYRLNKIESVTGCNPRKTADLFKLYTALTVRRVRLLK